MADDPWAGLVSPTPPPKPGPDWSGFSPQSPESTVAPDPVQYQMRRAQAIDDPDPVSQKLKGYSSEAFKQGGIGGTVGGVALGALAAASRIGEMTADFPKSLVEGAIDLATLPGDVRDGKVKTDEDLIPRVFNAAQFAIGAPAGEAIFGHIGETPLVPTKKGDLARIVPDEQGRPTARVIGSPPQEADFQTAARAIDPTGGLTPPAADVKPSNIKPIEGSPNAAVPRSVLARTEVPEINAILEDMKGVIDNPVVDRTKPVPYEAGGSVPLSRPTTYLDPKVPETFTVARLSNPRKTITFDTAEPTVIHENVEEKAMDILTKAGMPVPVAYRFSHFELAEVAEHAWYTKNDIDPAAAEAQWKKLQPGIQHEDATGYPADLYHREYPGGNVLAARHEDVFEAMPTAEEKAQGYKIIRDYYANRPPSTIADKLKSQWQTYGVHPYEAADVAANRPVMARDLSSASSPVLPLPARPSKNYLREVDDNFHRLRGAHTADQAEMLQRLNDLPSNVKNAEMQRKWYQYGEGDPEAHLTPEEGKLYNEVMIPLKKEELQLWEEAKATELDGIGEYDPTYMHRVVVGKTPQIDKLAGEGGAGANPIYNGPGILARSTSSMHDRKFFALENESGERQIVSLTKGEMSFIHPTSAEQRSFRSDDPLKIGSQIKLDQTYTIKQALTSEIEANTKVRYYKNALVNTMDNVLHLRAVTRAIAEIQRLRDTPEWAEYTTTTYAHQDKTEGWVTPQMPMFKNDLMDPKLAHIIDDFYGQVPQDGLQAALEKINHFAVGSMFWTPVPHALNAGAWWAVERSWDWITPQGMRSLVVDGTSAIRQVVTQGPEYQRLLREGHSLMYGGIANRDFYQKLLKRAGMELPKQQEEWEKIAKIVGQAPLDLVRGIYNASANTLWAFSDAVAMQRVMELERKGMSAREAIKSAEEIMPNYRVPSEILGSRSIQQIYTNPNLFQFSRYHWGVLQGYANMAKALAVGNLKQKSDAIGGIMALGVLQLLVWPGMSAGIQELTGNKNLKLPSAGPGKLVEPIIGAVIAKDPNSYPKFIRDYYHNDTDLMRQLANLAPLSPVVKWGLETGTNRDFYTGKPIVEPTDVRQGRIGRVLGQTAEHTAGSLVEPYNTLREAWRQGTSIPQKIVEGAFGLQDHTDKQEQARTRAFHYQDKEAARRKPQGLIEDVTK